MALIFQYGSNTLNSEINSKARLCGDAVFKCIAETVDDYSLAFQVDSKTRNCAASTIVPQTGEKVWGVVWEVPDHLLSRESSGERKSLDAIEGEGRNYKRQAIKVRDASGNETEATTYVALNPEDGLRTSVEYAGYIVNGLREHGVPETYVERVIQSVRENNAAIDSKAFGI